MRLNITLRLVLVGSLLVAGSALGTTAFAAGADPEFVGMLSLLEDAKTLSQLEVSDEVAEKLAALIKQREDAAGDLVLSLKELSPEEKTAKVKAFAAESEKIGLTLLTEEQRTKLSQLRIARAGLVTLAEPKIADEVGLSAQEKKHVATLIAELKTKLTKGTGRERQTATGEYERKLSAMLSKDQKARWDALAGKAPAVTAVAKKDDDKEPMESEKEPGTKPSTTKPAATAKTIKPASGEKKDVKLTFTFVYQPYKDVLEWLAKESDLSLDADVIPPGTFNYTDSKEYSPAGAIDVINNLLQFKGYLLIRQGRLLRVINIEDGVPRHIVSQVDEKQLETRGESEIVTVLFQLARMLPDEAAVEVEKMKSPYGSVVTLPRARQLLVTDSVGVLRQMKKMIDAIEKPSHGIADSPQWETYPLGAFDATVISEMLSSVLFDLPEPMKKFAIDPKAGIIVLHTTLDGHKRVKAMLDSLQKDGTNTAVFKVKGDPQALVLAINKLFGTSDAGSTCKVEADSTTMQLMVRGSKAQVEQIRKFLEDKDELPLPVEPGGPTVRSTRRTISIAGTAAQQRMLEAAASTFQTLHGNKVNMPKFSTSDAGAPNGFQGFDQGFDRGGGFDRGYGRGFGGGGYNDPNSLIGPPTNPAVPPKTETPREPAKPTTSGFAPRVAPKTPMTPPPAASPAEPPKTEAPKAAPEAAKPSDKTARRGSPSRYQFVGFGQEEPAAKESAKKEPADEKPAEEKSAKTEPATPEAAKEPAEPAKEQPAEETAEQPAKTETKPAQPADTLNALLEKYGQEVVVYVAQLFKDLDKNNDLLLSSEECKAHKWATPIEESDTNKDGQISFEEMCARKAKSLAQAQAAPQEKTVPGAPINITITPSGITISSQDLDALDEFESILQELAAVESDPVKRLKTIKLRFIKAENAAALVQEILSGGSSNESAGGGTLMGDMMGMVMGGNPLGNLMGGGGGGNTTTTAAGSAISIVADPRRNELWVSATTRDFDRVSDIVKAIDRMPEEGIETVPPPRYIKVRNQNAEDIAAKIRTLYAGRLGSGDSSTQNRQPNPADFFNALRGRGGNQNKPTKGEEIKMSLAVDERSNQLIVSAPDYLFHEIEQLVKDLDTAPVNADEYTAVVKLEGANADLIQRSLKSMFPNVTTGKTPQTTTGQTGLTRNGSGSGQDTTGQSPFNPGMFGMPGMGGGFPGGGFPGGGGFGGRGGGFGGRGGGGGFPGGGGGGFPGGGGGGRGGGGGGFPGGGGGFPGGGGGFPGGGGGGRGGGGGFQ